MKKIHRFLVTELPAGETVTIRDERIAHQVSSVLKIAPGEEIAFFADGGDDAVASLVERGKHELTVQVLRTIPALPAPSLSLTAAVCIPKGDTFEIIVQKLTELGVSRIVPVISGRTVKQSVRIERLQAISDEALEQCGGNRRVEINEPLTLAECTSRFALPAVVFDVSGAAEAPTLSGAAIMYIGPEGGWSDDDLAHLAGAQTAALGPRTLRTETAAIVAAYRLLWN